jgi:xylulokinase
MRTLVLGVDSGTQSTKVLVVNARDGAVVGEAARAYGLIAGLPHGAKEQHPRAWREAASHAIIDALKQAKASPQEVAALGVSGQQHGFVPLDKEGEVIRPAKLWCDTSTAAECEQLTNKLGGAKAVIEEIGNAILPGFTASKILWLKRKEPKNFARLATVLLPHDYLNFWLTGNKSATPAAPRCWTSKSANGPARSCRPSTPAWNAPCRPWPPATGPPARCRNRRRGNWA